MPTILIKTPDEIESMRATCRLAAQTLKMIEPYVQPGVTTQKINDLCHEFILDNHAKPSPLNYRGFPKSICTSINQQVCHGIPGSRVLNSGDILNIDVTTYLNGFHGDTNKTFHVGIPSPKGLRITEIAKKCLEVGIRAVRPKGFFGDIGAAIETLALKHKCSVVREYCGHGIGRDFHEEPAVLHYGVAGTGAGLKPGMIFTIEPMINLGRAEIRLLPDKWTVVTKDHSLSAQFEHTILVTPTGFEVLTDLDGEYIH
ncbi:MAG: type I methionyl aminopeptidase [Magnetococcales bacterium]|nr:type I methionyl aminopeptidase [Magnetococcales bacterium]MBF0438480.1 type I methionyl aminopeptidase [Magnetococcales bacterium]